MRRVLAGLVLGAAAFASVPAEAAGPAYGVKPILWTGEYGRYGAGAMYTYDGERWYPLGGAYVNTTTGTACVGFSYQIPLCVGGPIEAD